jgi:hypothetical protein
LQITVSNLPKVNYTVQGRDKTQQKLFLGYKVLINPPSTPSGDKRSEGNWEKKKKMKRQTEKIQEELKEIT